MPSNRSMDSPPEISDAEAAFLDRHFRWQEDFAEVRMESMLREEKWLEDNPEPVFEEPAPKFDAFAIAKQGLLDHVEKMK